MPAWHLHSVQGGLVDVLLRAILLAAVEHAISSASLIDRIAIVPQVDCK